MKIKLAIDAERISPMKMLDMDIDVSKTYRPSDFEGMECIKCDGEYFKVPDGENDLAKIVESKNQITEAEAIGLQGMMEKYIAPFFDVTKE